jgi:hypothetical protein
MKKLKTDLFFSLFRMVLFNTYLPLPKSLPQRGRDFKNHLFIFQNNSQFNPGLPLFPGRGGRKGVRLFIINIKKIVPLVVGNNKGRHIHDHYFSYRLHSKVFKIDKLYRFDVLGSKYCSRSAY